MKSNDPIAQITVSGRRSERAPKTSEQFICMDPFIHHQNNPLHRTGGRRLISHSKPARCFGVGSEKHHAHSNLGFTELEHWERQCAGIAPAAAAASAESKQDGVAWPSRGPTGGSCGVDGAGNKQRGREGAVLLKEDPGRNTAWCRGQHAEGERQQQTLE
ncbi:PREDICTED: uncharacterized protein LOC108445713 isoform X4 [Corvus brachyrhynchos]|uniref:uncharacterized protein LOC108445713 isoform X4 n=1 Tax=Corvus brachyrhynchos TaxID=85066 RepID=UPI0008166FB6|nr:PREDICTED: uncharacterized protein LOC108445713 isoform X4 [Corvus brachyrhynchos]XP_041900971.1 uncharacterized protein LOC121672398 isoform X4 [Corvus kubaryi]XP_041900979.1 uncharacterized protein LOC121672401 isoform X4 [Corvus kubaryi]